jgi:hypothetical protein
MRANCIICGKREDQHHSFDPEIEGCVCDNSWDGTAPAVCSTYLEDPVSGACSTCGHERACHHPEGA